jgi:uncharacterized damage-inducible protein DinB
MDEMRALFAYNRWASLRMLEAVGELTRQELGQDLVSSFPSVASTLTHMVGAEWVWLERWKGASPTTFPDAASLDSVDAIRARWTVIWEEQDAYFAGLPHGAERRAIAYTLMNGTPDTQALGDLARHVVNHATYHRGQLVTMLRQLGRTPPSTDYVRWLREA